MNTVESENEIARDSWLRRDDVGDASKDGAQREVKDCSRHPSPTDQALIEGLARAIASRYGADPDQMGFWTLGQSNTNTPSPYWQEFTSHAEAALLYMQQHVRPLVEALELSNQALSMLGSEIPKLKAYTGKDPRLATPANYAAELSGMATKRINKALSSLPPVLRGGE